MAERAMPVLLPGGDLVVPAGDLAELLAVLRLHSDACRGVARPGAAGRPVLTPAVRTLTMAAEQGAVTYQRVRHRASAAGPSALTSRPDVVSRSDVDGGLTVGNAAQWLAVTERHVRRLLEAGHLSGSKDTRDVWVVEATSVRAYAKARQVSA